MNAPEPAWRKSSYSTDNGDCVEVAWRKSSYSTNNGGCVEVGWRKSSHSTNNGACVEVGWQQPHALVRDSKQPAGGALTVEHDQWRALLSALR